MSSDTECRSQDDQWKNWLEATECLRIVRTKLRDFLETETETFHNGLSSKVLTVSRGGICRSKCTTKKFTPKPQKVPALCGVCVPWREEILARHIAKGGIIYWNNSVPQLWPSRKWEVAKVYMSRGHRGHKCFDDFDISALFNLMTNCDHFRVFIESQKLLQVLNVRNSVMHCPDFRICTEDLKEHLKKIKELGQSLESHVPDLKTLPDEIDKLEKLLAVAYLPRFEAALPENEPDELEIFWEIEIHALREKIKFLCQLFEDKLMDGLKEEVVGVLIFLQKNWDLEQKLSTEQERLFWILGQLEEQEQKAKTERALKILLLSLGLVLTIHFLRSEL